jgi:DNA primase
VDSSDTTKYLIHLFIHAEGVVDKSDVVGAIFGQTEGLLGEEMDLRDLQRTGRVGRIDVQIESRKGETKGEILISSSLDRAETAVLASALESIDRVGPCIAHVTVDRIEDIRVTKKRKIVERAKELLLDYFEDMPIDTSELLDQVRDSIRIEKLVELGVERLPAGPNVKESDAIIIVEGRADVINLLRYGVKNAIAVEGTRVPRTIIDLCETKVATAFLDGDRGGELILRELLQVADIDFVAYSPRGRSVEEMSRKEITKALRNKIPVEFVREQHAQREGEKPSREFPLPVPAELPAGEPKRTSVSEPITKEAEGPAPGPSRAVSLSQHMREVQGKKVARLLSPEFTVVEEVRAEDIEMALQKPDGHLAGVIIDRVVDQRLLDTFTSHGVEFIAAKDFKGIIKRPSSVKLLKMG